MDRISAVSYASSAGNTRAPGWQAQVRIDYVVNRVALTHRGQDRDQVAQAIHEQLRAVGVVPNGRQITQYATAISALPQLSAAPR